MADNDFEADVRKVQTFAEGKTVEQLDLDGTTFCFTFNDNSKLTIVSTSHGSSWDDGCYEGSRVSMIHPDGKQETIEWY